MAQCSKCGNNQSPEHSQFCSVCSHPLFYAEETVSQSATAPQGVPWEQIDRLGLWGAIAATLKKCLTAPSSFFSDLAASQNSTMAWVFALLIGSIGSIFSFLWTIFLISPLFDLVPGLDAYTGKNMFTTAQLVFAPFIITIKLVLLSCYFHFLLFCTRSSRKDLSATFRILCYTQCASIFECIPVIGSFISIVLSLYLLAIGFHKIHGISMLRAWMIIILLPVILSVVVGVVAALIFGTGLVLLDILKDSMHLIR
jgi:hypothetical protein